MVRWPRDCFEARPEAVRGTGRTAELDEPRERRSRLLLVEEGSSLRPLARRPDRY
jgi:hypothetical protein